MKKAMKAQQAAASQLGCLYAEWQPAQSVHRLRFNVHRLCVHLQLRHVARLCKIAFSIAWKVSVMATDAMCSVQQTSLDRIQVISNWDLCGALISL